MCCLFTHFLPCTLYHGKNNPFFSDFRKKKRQNLLPWTNYHGHETTQCILEYTLARHYQGKRVNAPYRRCSYESNPSEFTFRHGTAQFFRGCNLSVVWMDVFVRDLFMSFRFVSKQNPQRYGDVFDILITNKGTSPLVCFNTLRNFKRTLNKRWTSSAQTITTEWTAEKCLEKLTREKQTMPKHKLGNRKKTDNRNTSACRRSIQFNSIATQVAEKQFMQQAVGNTSNRICYKLMCLINY